MATMTRSACTFIVLVIAAASSVSLCADAQQPTAPQKKAKARERLAIRETPGVRVVPDVAYLGGERKEKMDIYLPADAAAGQTLPCVIDIHGGGFTGGDNRDRREQQICTTLAQRGYVAASINYFLPEEDQLSGFPRNIHDCKTAVRYLRKHAAEYHIDPAKIGVIGGSAGGHLATILAVTKNGDELDPRQPYGDVSCAVQAAVDLYGPVDWAAEPQTAAGTTFEGFLTRVQKALPPEKLKLYSPAEHITAQIAPLMILQGGQDTSVPASQSERLAAKLKAAGATYYYYLLPDAKHSFDLISSGTDLRDTVTAFFDKHLQGKDIQVPEPRKAASRRAGSSKTN